MPKQALNKERRIKSVKNPILRNNHLFRKGISMVSDAIHIPPKKASSILKSAKVGMK